MTKLWSCATLLGMTFSAGIAAAFCGGCELLVNPFADELVVVPPATTPSAQAARQREVEDRPPVPRPFAATTPPRVDPGVTHGPLYFEDPFELPDPDRETFAWTGEDYLAMVYGPARFLVNAVLTPVGKALEPPWLVMRSDGTSAPAGLLRESRDAQPPRPAPAQPDTTGNEVSPEPSASAP